MPFFFKNNKFLKNRIGSYSLESRSREGLELPGFPLPCLWEAGAEMRQREVCSFYLGSRRPRALPVDECANVWPGCPPTGA